jgi:hypothetical protein
MKTSRNQELVVALVVMAVACLLILWGVLQDPNQLPIPM